MASKSSRGRTRHPIRALAFSRALRAPAPRARAQARPPRRRPSAHRHRATRTTSATSPRLPRSGAKRQPAPSTARPRQPPASAPYTARVNSWDAVWRRPVTSWRAAGGGLASGLTLTINLPRPWRPGLSVPLVWLRTSCSQQPGSLRDRPAGRLTRSTGRRSSGELQGRALPAAPRRCALPVHRRCRARRPADHQDGCGRAFFDRGQADVAAGQHTLPPSQLCKSTSFTARVMHHRSL